MRNKLQRLLKRNYGYEALVVVKSYLDGTDLELPEIVPAMLTPAFKFCPVTSVDFEGSFSRYKFILIEKFHKLILENLEKIGF